MHFPILIRSICLSQSRKLSLCGIALAPILTVLLSACVSGSGFNIDQMNQVMDVKRQDATDAEIKKTLDLKPNLPRPFKLGILFIPPTWGFGNWTWTAADKARFLEVPETLKDGKGISDAVEVMDSTVAKSRDIRAIRLAAARYKADAVLVIAGAGDVDRYNNSLGVTYFAILPMLFVPGSEADTLFRVQATLWDVRNEYLYITSEAEHMTNESYVPAFGRTNKERLSEAKALALDKLKKDLVTRLVRTQPK